MDIRLPNGTVIQNVPEGTTKEQVMERAIATGLATPEDFGQTQQPNPLPEAVAETAASIATGAIAEPIAGLAGIAQTLNPFADPGAGARAVEATREALTYRPAISGAQEALQTVGETLAPVGEVIQSAETGLGEATLEATDSPVMATLAHSIPTALLELGAVGTAKVAGPTVRGAKRQLEKAKQFQSPVKKRIAKKLEAGEFNAETAGFKLTEQGLAKANRAEREAIRQGFDDGLVGALKGASKSDRSKLLKMTALKEKALKDPIFASKSRPSDVVGDSLMDRVRYVDKVKRAAGKRIDKAAKNLRGQQVEVEGIVDQFTNDLADLDIKLVQRDGVTIPDFKGSAIEGLSEPQAAIERMVRRMSSPQKVDALELHKVKRFIDEGINYGSDTPGGLKGSVERVLKNLRRNIDAELDGKFPEYDKANTAYADTAGVINDIQTLLGNRVDLLDKGADKALGTKLRMQLSNAPGRVPWVNAVDDVEAIARKYGGKFDDDITMQMVFADQLESRFKTQATTSLQGQTARGVREGIPTSPRDVAVETLAKTAEKVRGVTDDNALRAMRELLKEAQQ
jgi:hypothetical protein